MATNRKTQALLLQATVLLAEAVNSMNEQPQPEQNFTDWRGSPCEEIRTPLSDAEQARMFDVLLNRSKIHPNTRAFLEDLLLSFENEGLSLKQQTALRRNYLKFGIGGKHGR